MRDYKKLQIAHFELMKQYAEVLQKTSSLPFFINISHLRNIKIIKSKTSVLLYLYTVLSSFVKYLVKFLVWKLVVTLFIEAHIRSKLKEISKIYIQNLQTVNPKAKGSKVYIQWLNQSIDSCELFSSTMSSWVGVKEWMVWIFNIIIGLILAWVGLDNIFQAIIRISMENSTTSFLIIVAGAILIFIIYGFIFYTAISYSFFVKRVLLFPNIDLKRRADYRFLPSKNTYKLEDNLFKLIQVKKKKEFPIDLFVLFLTSCVLPILALLFIFISTANQFSELNAWNVLISFIIFAIIPLGIGISYINEWKKREWR